MTGTDTGIPNQPGLAEPLFHVDQYHAFGRLREERPVSLGRHYDGTPIWLVTTYEDVRTVLHDRRFVNDPCQQSKLDVVATFGLPPELKPFFERTLIGADPPDHTRLRRMVAHAFTPGRIEALRPTIQRTTDQLLDELAGLDVVDLVDRFAHPLPIVIISEILGVPAEDRDNWRHWATGLVQTDADPRVDQARLAEGATGSL